MDWYWIVLIVLFGLVLLYTIFCFLISKRVLKAATTPVAHTLDEARAFQTEHENMDFSDFDTVWQKEKFEIDGEHGKIRGEIIFNEQKNLPEKVAVICHGHTWNRLNSVKYAKIFYDKGYNVVIYDHAYFGESDGKFTTLGYYEQYDLSKVLDLVRSKFKDAFVGLHGESMGAATVLQVLSLRTDIDFVIADCSFSDTMKYYRELCHKLRIPSFPVVDFANMLSKRKFGYDFHKVSPIKAVAKSNTPICFIHGKADTFILPSHSEKLYGACQNPLSELHLVEGAGHARSHVTDNRLYRSIMENFLDKVEKAHEQSV